MPARYGTGWSFLTYGLRYASVGCALSAVVLLILNVLTWFGFEFIPRESPLVISVGGTVGIYLIVTMALKKSMVEVIHFAVWILAMPWIVVTGIVNPSSMWSVPTALLLLFVAAALSAGWRILHKRRMLTLHLGDQREFVFLLRSFTNDALATVETEDHLSHGGTAPRRHHAVELIEHELARSYGMVFLQYQPHSTMHFTHALEIRTASNWKDWFEYICARAKAILLLPELTDGIVMEMEALKMNGWMSKTIVVGVPGNDARGRWGEVRTRLRDVGIVLPEHSREGGLYRFDADGTAVRAHAFGQLMSALDDERLHGDPISALAAVLSLAESDELAPAS